MKVLITGSNGFIGKNLCQRLKASSDIEIIQFDKEDSFSVIENNIDTIDFIFHLAGINRPKDVSEFYEGNTDLTRKIVNLLENKKVSVPILMTSSIQAMNNTDYGKSKKQAEEILHTYNQNHIFIYRLNNVFGKWCKPNYNSVVATFCYNIAHNIDITVDNADAMIELVYIDDVVDEFIQMMKGQKLINKENLYYYIKPSYQITVGVLATKIKEFKNNMESIIVPTTGDEFIKKLFSTYLSYVELDDMVFTPKMNIDERGSFTELIKTVDSGQISVSVSKKGVYRGNHYHHTKMEKFIVLKGKAKITFKHVLNGEMKEYFVDDQIFKIVNIPVGYTHKIENIGEEDMILLLWCNEIFDANKPDTYTMEVK